MADAPPTPLSAVPPALPGGPPVVRRVLVVEDDPVLEAEALDAVAVFHDAEVRVARTVAEGERLARRHAFDLAVVDLGLPDGSGLTLLRRLREEAEARGDAPPVCVARTVFDDDAHLFGALGAGAQGFLLKGEAPALLRARLLAAMSGEPVLSPAIARRVLDRFRTPSSAVDARAPAPVAPSDRLTTREAEVLRLVARGLTVPEVAQALGVSTNTVKTHVKGAYLKLDATTRVGALDAARRRGLLPAAD